MCAAKSPKNFSYVTENTVAGFGFPFFRPQVDFLVNKEQITNIITMCQQLPKDFPSFPNLNYHYFPVYEFQAPSQSVIDRCMEIINEALARNEKVGVHCLMGMGRAGTILACHLVQSRGMTGLDAISYLRSIRPGSIESPAQENAIIEFHKRNSLKNAP